jgi:Zn-dependent protease
MYWLFKPKQNLKWQKKMLSQYGMLSSNMHTYHCINFIFTYWWTLLYLSPQFKLFILVPFFPFDGVVIDITYILRYYIPKTKIVLYCGWLAILYSRNRNTYVLWLVRELTPLFNINRIYQTQYKYVRKS